MLLPQLQGDVSKTVGHTENGGGHTQPVCVLLLTISHHRYSERESCMPIDHSNGAAVQLLAKIGKLSCKSYADLFGICELVAQ